jgi:hypothetical protein
MLTRGVCVSLAVALLAAGGAVARTGSHPRFQASIRGENRAPLVGQSWGYVVRAADSSGRPVGGTAVVRVALRGRIVNTIGWFRFNGRLHRWYRWSPALVGTSAVLQAKVVALGGTRTVGYHVRVRGRSSASARARLS